MQILKLHPITVDGAAVQVFRNGIAPHATVFVDAAAPGTTPYGAGSHLWGSVLDRFAEDGPLAVIDSLTAFAGCGSAAGPGIDEVTKRLQATIHGLGLIRCHIVAHDVAGLAAMLLAHQAPDLIAGVTAVSCVSASPTRDSEENKIFAYPFCDAGTHYAQRWALERLSYSHQHVDEALLDACVCAVKSAPWLEVAADAGKLFCWSNSIMRARARLYAICRDDGIHVPIQFIWGTHDPLGSIEHGLCVFQILAQSQPAAQFHLLNRAGALPFREEPEGFHQAVSAFIDVTLRSPIDMST